MSRSYAARFALIALIFIGIQIVVLAIGWMALNAINATRSYATGESLYSKGQKAAVLHFFKYAQSGDERYFDAFLSSINVPLGDRVAREALDRVDPDVELGAAGLRQSLTDEDDIPSVIRVFVWLRHWAPFAMAVEDWREGDRLIAKLISAAEKFHALQQSGALSMSDRRRDIVAEVDALNTDLEMLEYRFSKHLGEAARMAMHLVSVSLAICSLVLWTAGLWLAWRTYWTGIERDLQLKESERRFRDFAEIASDWFWQTDANLRISYLSERFGEAINAKPEDLLGKTLSEIGLEAVGDDVRQHIADVAARRPFRSAGLRYSLGGGQDRYWAISGVPVFSNDGSFVGYRGTGREVTAEIRAKQALEEAKSQSEVASRAKSEFLATMSHELRTPLNAIIGFSEVIKDRLFGAAIDKYADYAHDIFASGKHLLAIINDILDVSKIEAGQMELYEENVEIAVIVETVIQLLKQKIELAKVHVTVETAAGLPMTRADERKLKQIVMNLVSNAVKFTPAGGAVVILSSIDAAGDLSIEVRDTGIGMAPEEIPKALAAFGQVDSSLARKHEGTGLGLPLVKALVEMHGGRFTLLSERGRGTSAIVTLPKARLTSLAA
jgi:PAS domain S-box-containing protein